MTPINRPEYVLYESNYQISHRNSLMSTTSPITSATDGSTSKSSKDATSSHKASNGQTISFAPTSTKQGTMKQPSLPASGNTSGDRSFSSSLSTTLASNMLEINMFNISKMCYKNTTPSQLIGTARNLLASTLSGTMRRSTQNKLAACP